MVPHRKQALPTHCLVSKTSFKDDNLHQHQGVMVLLPSGMQLSSDVIAVVQSKETTLKTSIKVPEAVMDPK